MTPYETVACPLCGSTRALERLRQRDVNLCMSEDEFSLMTCLECGLIYLNPRPTAQAIGKFYPDEYYPCTPGPKGHVGRRTSKKLSAIIKQAIREEFYGYPVQGTPSKWQRVRRWMLYPEYLHLKLAGRESLRYSGEGRLLDVGCGPGKTMVLLREQGWDTVGVDFSSVAAEYARSQHGLDVFCGELAQAGHKESSFDVVMFSHSLEHLYDPLETLKEAHRILKPGGRLVVVVPNAASFEARIFGKWWVHWDVPRHLTHFTRVTLRQLLESCGFRISSVQYGMTPSSFLGSLDYVARHVRGRPLGKNRALRLLARPICLIAGHLRSGSELRMEAVKPG